MIPLIPTLVSAFVSFLSSAFVILRILIPILPPSPLSRRVPPSEFGLPNFRSLSPADKSHIWLASLDILALAVFVWQSVTEYTGGPKDFAIAYDPASATRIWFALTLRQTCLFVIASITLLHVRLGRSISFGSKHWLVWAPTATLVVTSTALAGVLSGAGVQTLFVGITAYSLTFAIMSSASFCFLIGTLLVIKKNLAAMNEVADPWPPASQLQDKPRPSFATEDVDCLRDGASWITSHGGSHRDSVSNWSFTTHHTSHHTSHHGHGSTRIHPAIASYPSIPAKSSFWFSPATPHDAAAPPVPPLPTPYGPLSPTAATLSDPDPFRRDMPPPLSGHPQKDRTGSQNSWLSSPSASQVTLSAWSYPTTHHEGSSNGSSVVDLNAGLLPGPGAHSRPNTPALSNAQVLGGYGYDSKGVQVEKGLTSLAAPPGTSIDISVYRAIAWLVVIWVPLVLSLPYFATVGSIEPHSKAIQICFVLSVTISSPLLALNLVFRSPLPIPSGLFDVRAQPPPSVMRGPSPTSMAEMSDAYKRSGSSMTVVEGRRSGDVWIANGDAIDGKSKVGRALGLLAPAPKLAVLPHEEEPQDGELTPPLPMQLEDAPNTPYSAVSEEFGRFSRKSKASSRFSGGTAEYASQIMIAQRHYSTLAQTFLVQASPEKSEEVKVEVIGTASGAETTAARPGAGAHLRARSISSVSGPQTPTGTTFSISPPPSFPLPPTPPNVRAARLAKLGHKKSFSSGFAFGSVEDINEIDALTAGVLPLLVPGLKVGDSMKVVAERRISQRSSARFSINNGEFGVVKGNDGKNIESPETHSTPARKRSKDLRARKISGHKNHFSLPSLGLGKDSMQALTNEISRAFESKVSQFATVSGDVRRATVWGGESVVAPALTELSVVHEEAEPRAKGTAGENKKRRNDTGLGRSMSTRSLGLRADVPHNVDHARTSVSSIHELPPSAASTVTLFEFEAGLEEIGQPQAESTPHQSVSGKPTSKHPPPPMPAIMPLVPASGSTRSKSSKRSSIVYIKSDENAVPDLTSIRSTASGNRSSSANNQRISQWSSKVRPLSAKSSRLERKSSENSISSVGSTNSKTGRSAGKGLRPLSLLRDRDTNSSSEGSPSSVGSTRPLALGKKKRGGLSIIVDRDENSNASEAVAELGSDAGYQNLKPLTLARSETSKMRGILRRGEVIPDVVVRPPSNDYGYTPYEFTVQ